MQVNNANVLPECCQNRGHQLVFTDKLINSLKAKEDIYELWEGGHGFGIRVNPGGRKTWQYVYRIHGRQRRFRLGVYPHISLAKARKRHHDARTFVLDGIDPAGPLDEKKTSPTVAELAAEYLERWAKKRKRTWAEDERMLNKDVLPVWGPIKAAAIDAQEVMRLLDRVEQRGPVAANRLQSLLSKMFTFGVQRYLISTNPCAGLARIRPKEKKRDRVLSWEEISGLWDALEASGLSDEVKGILRLILITAQRPGEVAGMQWEEIEIDGNEWWWTIPADRSKSKRAHRVYLTPDARKFTGDPDTGPVFRGRDQARSIEVNVLSKALSRNRWFGLDHFTPHDLRRTAASMMAAKGLQRFTVRRVLGHADAEITATYDLYSYDKEKKDALELWARDLFDRIKKARLRIVK